ncbi:pilus assembly protein CpaB [Hyphomicrobium sp. 1Nfss2.1]|uniref:Flp pilus assembly protein CpaB n=1 Tax=Hyphomicrobium sp. 1Nfss2.1 TaxID=3413936 RepID=UPI003C7D67ED
MKRGQLIGIAIAGGAGLLAFILMRSIVNEPSAPKQVAVQVDATEVLVARHDIPLGQVTKATDFRWQTWPKEAVTPSFITEGSGGGMKVVEGAIARAPLLEGEPVTSQKLIKPGQGGVLAAILPSGMRAISTKIKEETAAGRLILPNDRVDVILTRRERSPTGQDEAVSDTLFQNVRVLAIGQSIGTKEGTKLSEGNASTATLELNPRQAELLARANSTGEISLALRSVVDGDLKGKGPTAAMNDQRGSTVRVLRYGVPSRAYGVN